MTQMNTPSPAALHRCYAWLREHHAEMVERRKERERREREEGQEREESVDDAA